MPSSTDLEVFNATLSEVHGKLFAEATTLCGKIQSQSDKITQLETRISEKDKLYKILNDKFIESQKESAERKKKIEALETLTYELNTKIGKLTDEAKIKDDKINKLTNERNDLITELRATQKDYGIVENKYENLRERYNTTVKGYNELVDRYNDTTMRLNKLSGEMTEKEVKKMAVWQYKGRSGYDNGGGGFSPPGIKR